MWFNCQYNTLFFETILVNIIFKKNIFSTNKIFKNSYKKKYLQIINLKDGLKLKEIDNLTYIFVRIINIYFFIVKNIFLKSENMKNENVNTNIAFKIYLNYKFFIFVY